jgi:hypothetical protein
MCSKDVTDVYAQLQLGAIVRIIPDSLPKLPKLKNPAKAVFTAAAPVPPVAPSAAKSVPGQKRVSTTASTRPSGDRA